MSSTIYAGYPKRLATLVTLVTILLSACGLKAITLIDTPIATNSIAGTNAPFWAGGPPANPLAVWQMTQIVKTNFAMLQAGFNGLTDTQTNALLKSGKAVYWATNSFTITYGTSNALPVMVTNFAGMDFSVTAGSPTPIISFDRGTNWVDGADVRYLFTNVPVKLGWRVTGFPPSSSFYLPIDGVVASITIYTNTRPDLFGKTNALYGESVRVGAPLMADEATPAWWVQWQIANAGWQNVGTDIQLNGHLWHMGSTWDQVIDTSNTNLDVVETRWLGQAMISVINPMSQLGRVTNLVPYVAAAPVASSARYGVGWNNYGDQPGQTNNCVELLIDTNSVSGSPVIEYSHSVASPNWVRLPCVSGWPNVTTLITTKTNWAGTIGTGYTISSYVFQTNTGVMLGFAMPNLDYGFVRLSWANPQAPVVALGGWVKLPMTTVTNAAESTGGYGAGILRADTNYVYLSVGTNAWKRAALGWDGGGGGGVTRFEGGPVVITDGGVFPMVIPHGLGRVPQDVRVVVRAVAVDANLGQPIGTESPAESWWDPNDVLPLFMVYADAINVTVSAEYLYGSAGLPTAGSPDNWANFAVVVYAQAW